MFAHYPHYGVSCHHRWSLCNNYQKMPFHKVVIYHRIRKHWLQEKNCDCDKCAANSPFFHISRCYVCGLFELERRPMIFCCKTETENSRQTKTMAIYCAAKINKWTIITAGADIRKDKLAHQDILEMFMSGLSTNKKLPFSEVSAAGCFRGSVDRPARFVLMIIESWNRQ